MKVQHKECPKDGHNKSKGGQSLRSKRGHSAAVCRSRDVISGSGGYINETCAESSGQSTPGDVCACCSEKIGS